MQPHAFIHMYTTTYLHVHSVVCSGFSRIARILPGKPSPQCRSQI